MEPSRFQKFRNWLLRGLGASGYDKRVFGELPAGATEYIKKVLKCIPRLPLRRRVRDDLIGRFNHQLAEYTAHDVREQKAREFAASLDPPKLFAKKVCIEAWYRRPLWKKILGYVFPALAGYFLAMLIMVVLGVPSTEVNYFAKLNALVKENKDPNENARPYYEIAAASMTEIPGKFSDLNWPGDLNDVDKASLSQLLSSNKTALEYIRKGVMKKYYYRPYISLFIQPRADLRPEDRVMVDLERSLAWSCDYAPLSDLRALAKLLSWEAIEHAYSGYNLQAFEDCLAVSHLGRQLRSNGPPRDQLVGMSIEAMAIRASFLILADMNCPAADRNYFERALRRFSNPPSTIDLSAEKLFVFDLIQLCFTRWGTPTPYAILLTFDADKHQFNWRYWLVPLLLSEKKAQADANSWLQTYDQYAGLEPFRTKDVNLPGYNWLFVSIGQKTVCVPWRVITERVGLLATLAVLHYRDDKGNYPDSLSELVAAGYLDKVPLDPFSGNPLVYRRTNGDFILYSVGANFKDDGGTVYYSKYSGVPELWYSKTPSDAVFWPVPKPKGPDPNYGRLNVNMLQMLPASPPGPNLPLQK